MAPAGLENSVSGLVVFAARLRDLGVSRHNLRMISKDACLKFSFYNKLKRIAQVCVLLAAGGQEPFLTFLSNCPIKPICFLKALDVEIICGQCANALLFGHIGKADELWMAKQFARF